MDLQIALFVAAVVLLASTSQTVAGFGFALIAVPFLITVLDVRDAIVVVSLLSLLNSALVARTTRGSIPRSTVITLLAGSLVGMPIGLVILLFAPADVLRLAVGVTSVVLALALLSGLHLGGAASTRSEAVAGGISGVLATSTGMNGPPIVIYLQDRGLPPLEFRAALAAFFLVNGAISLIIFAATGVIELHALALAAVAAPAVLLGNAAGHALVGRVSDAVFRQIVLLLLVATAIAAIAIALARLIT